jgi:hypothetical protein
MGVMISEAMEWPLKMGKTNTSNSSGLTADWYLAAFSWDINAPITFDPSKGGTGIRLNKARVIFS